MAEERRFNDPLIIEIRQDVKMILAEQAKVGQWMENHNIKTKEQDDRLSGYSKRIGILEKSKFIIYGIIITISAVLSGLYFILDHFKK